jgi:hypothetical protein
MYEIMGYMLGSLHVCPKRWWKLGVTVRNYFCMVKFPEILGSTTYTWCDWLWWMKNREMPRMHKYREIKTTWLMMATVRHITSGVGRTKFQAAWFLLNRAYKLSVKSCLGLYKCWVTHEMWTILMRYCSRSRGTEMKTELVGRLLDQVFMTNTSMFYRCSMRTL